MQEVQVSSAKLRLFSIDEGGGGIFYALPHAQQWSAQSLTWYNKGRKLDRSGEFQVASIDWCKEYEWNEIDVTKAFTDNASSAVVRTFLIKSKSTDGVEFASRESEFAPELLLTFTSGIRADAGSNQALVSFLLVCTTIEQLWTLNI